VVSLCILKHNNLRANIPDFKVSFFQPEQSGIQVLQRASRRVSRVLHPIQRLTDKTRFLQLNNIPYLVLNQNQIEVTVICWTPIWSNKRERGLLEKSYSVA